jgi:hypothetical protein
MIYVRPHCAILFCYARLNEPNPGESASYCQMLLRGSQHLLGFRLQEHPECIYGD